MYHAICSAAGPYARTENNPGADMQRKLINRRQVEARTGKSRWTIGRLEKKGLFPQRVNVTPGRNDYFEDEVDAYLEQLAAGREQATA
jgi:predicted DNA-binding transcriptional regulator AlpA